LGDLSYLKPKTNERLTIDLRINASEEKSLGSSKFNSHNTTLNLSFEPMQA